MLQTLILIATYIAFSIGGSPPFETIKINNKSNFHIEKIPNFQIHCSYEPIKFFLVLENYVHIKTELIIALDTLETECHKKEYISQCEEEVNEIFSLNSEINNKIHTIQAFRSLNQNKKRKKRNSIDKDTNNWFGLTGVDTQHNTQKLKDTIETLLLCMHSLSSNETNKTDNLEALLLITHDILIKHLEFYDRVIKIYQYEDSNALLTMIPLNTIYSELLHIDLLANKKSCSLPKMLNSIDIIDLLGISTFETELVDDIITIQINVPTVYDQQTKLYKIHSLPFESSNESYIVIPSSPFYVTMNDTGNNVTLIYALSSKDVSSCSNVSLGVFCYIENPTPYIGSLNFIDLDILNKFEKCHNKTLNELKANQNNCSIYKTTRKSEIVELATNIFYIHTSKEIYSTPAKHDSTIENNTINNMLVCVLSILTIISWIFLIFFLHKFNSKSYSPSQIQNSTSEPQKLDLNCRFSFNGPSLPARYAFQPYDVPKSTRTIIDDELEALNSSNNIEYASILKKKVIINENKNTEHELQT